jgi:hypothetical protein
MYLLSKFIFRFRKIRNKEIKLDFVEILWVRENPLKVEHTLCAVHKFKFTHDIKYLFVFIDLITRKNMH